MQTKDDVAILHRRANKVRRIAEGIFDKTERRFVVKFVSDCENSIALRGKKVAAKPV